jgi:hypothetical protein
VERDYYEDKWSKNMLLGDAVLRGELRAEEEE